MKIKLLLIVCISALSLLQGCANTATKKTANAMRIWISPAYRADVKVNQHGHMYVLVKQ